MNTKRQLNRQERRARLQAAKDKLKGHVLSLRLLDEATVEEAERWIAQINTCHNFGDLHRVRFLPRPYVVFDDALDTSRYAALKRYITP